MGRDRCISALASTDKGFNPRARMGRDRYAKQLHWLSVCFNPRARMGRDSVVRFLQSLSSSFNPRARMGRDAGKSTGEFAKMMFQPTRPHGARPVPLPRLFHSSPVSTHAPAWGATAGGNA